MRGRFIVTYVIFILLEIYLDQTVTAPASDTAQSGLDRSIWAFACAGAADRLLADKIS